MDFEKIRRIAAAFAIFLAWSVSGASEVSPAKPFPSGNITRSRVSFRLAIFCLPTCSPDVSANFAVDVKSVDPQLAVAKLTLPKQATGRVVAMNIENDVPRRMPPPEAEYLRHVGYGLSQDQTSLLPSCQQALIFDFGYPSTDAWKGLLSANILVEAMARKSGGLIWDG